MVVTPNGNEGAKALMQLVRWVCDGVLVETFAEVNQDRVEITAAQFDLLRYIDRHVSPTIGEVAEGLKISSAAATKGVAGLAERAEPLVERQRGTDRREVHLRTTPAGEALVELVRERFTTKLEAILGRMDDEDRRALDRGVLALLEAALVSPADCDAACLRCGVEREEDCLVHLAELSMGYQARC